MTATQKDCGKATRAAVIDEYGEKDRQRQELKLKLKPLDSECKKLEGIICGWCLDFPPDLGTVVEGQRYTVRVSPREEQTKIVDIRKVAKAMGAEAFYDACKISLEALKAAVLKEKFASLVRTARTGSRTVTAVAKAAPAVELPKAA